MNTKLKKVLKNFQTVVSFTSSLKCEAFLVAHRQILFRAPFKFFECKERNGAEGI